MLLFVFWFLWFLNFSSRTVLSPLLPIFEQDLGISHALAGSIFFSLSLGYTLSLLVSGWLTVKIGFKRSILLGFSVLAVAMFCLPFATSYILISSFTLAMGIGAGLYLPSAIPILTRAIKPDRWGKAFAFHETAASFSILSIPLLASVVLRYFGWRGLIFMISGACVAAVAAFSVLSPDPRQKSITGSGYLSTLKRRDFWAMAILWGFAGASSLGLYNIIPLFLVTERGFDLETANRVFGLSRVGGLILTFMAGYLADRYGARRVLLLALLMTGAATVAMALVKPFPLLVAALVTQATFCPVFFPVGLVAISKITDFDERSLFTGITVAFGVIFGNGFTPFLLGVAADVWSFQVGILALGFLTSLSTVLLRQLRGI